MVLRCDVCDAVEFVRARGGGPLAPGTLCPGGTWNGVGARPRTGTGIVDVVERRVDSALRGVDAAELGSSVGGVVESRPKVPNVGEAMPANVVGRLTRLPKVPAVPVLLAPDILDSGRRLATLSTSSPIGSNVRSFGTPSLRASAWTLPSSPVNVHEKGCSGDGDLDTLGLAESARCASVTSPWSRRDISSKRAFISPSDSESVSADKTCAGPWSASGSGSCLSATTSETGATIVLTDATGDGGAAPCCGCCARPATAISAAMLGRWVRFLRALLNDGDDAVPTVLGGEERKL